MEEEPRGGAPEEGMKPEEDTNRIFWARRTVLQMLKDRGYKVRESAIDLSKDEFIKRYGDPVRRNELTIHLEKAADPNDKIIVFFLDQSKTGVGAVKTCMDKMKEQNVRSGILVMQKLLSRQAGAEALQSNECLQVFQEGELLVNITHHHLYQKHELISDKEKKELLEKYTAKETQLPQILFTDPGARYLGLKRGQVVKITRESEGDIVGEYPYYRICT